MPYYPNVIMKGRIYIGQLQKAYSECHYFFQVYTLNYKNTDP